MTQRPRTGRRIGVLALALAVWATTTMGCAKPPVDLDPAALPYWRANEVQVAFGAVQHAAIELNKLQKSDGTRVLSDASTLTVIGIVEDVVLTLRRTPEGWVGIANGGLQRLTERLDPEARARLGSYLDVIRDLLEGL